MRDEPAAFSWKHDRPQSLEVYGRWAEEAWASESVNCPDLASERDYYLGFRDGFVDYVWAGGNGEPPPVPPRHFWNVMLRSPDGKRRADLWFNGYRHGARVARFGGYRELGTVHSSLAGLSRDSIGMPPYENLPMDEMAPGLPEAFAPPPMNEALPEPPAEQPSARFGAPVDALTRQISTAPDKKPSRPSRTVGNRERPMEKQPAALEALGLALLPTEQRSSASPKTLAERNGERTSMRNFKSAGRHHAPDRRPVGRAVATAAETAVDVAIVRESGRQRTPIDRTQNHTSDFVATTNKVPDRQIALNGLHNSSPASLAPHSDAIREEPTASTQATGESSSFELATATNAVVNPRPESRSDASRKTNTVIAAAHAEPVTPIAKEPDLPLGIAGGSPTQPAAAPLKIVDTAMEPSPELAIKATRASEASASSAPRIRLSDEQDRGVERIVIAAPSNKGPKSGDTARSHPGESVVRFRTTVSEAERIPSTHKTQAK